MLPSLPFPSIFAHRGDSKHAPENTLAAFQRALETGCEGIELDVRLTADSRVVVCHDATVDRTTNGHGHIDHMTLSQVQSLDAGEWFGAGFKGERVPTLVQVFERFSSKTLLNVELKPNWNDAAKLAQLVAQLMKDFDLRNRVIISSFSAKAMRETREHLPEGFFSLLAPIGMVGWWARRIAFHQQPYFALHPHYRDVSQNNIKQHPRQIAYTVNRPNEMRRLFSWGIQGIITDDPGLAVKIRAEAPV